MIIAALLAFGALLLSWLLAPAEARRRDSEDFSREAGAVGGREPGLAEAA